MPNDLGVIPLPLYFCALTAGHSLQIDTTLYPPKKTETPHPIGGRSYALRSNILVPQAAAAAQLHPIIFPRSSSMSLAAAPSWDCEAREAQYDHSVCHVPNIAAAFTISL